MHLHPYIYILIYKSDLRAWCISLSIHGQYRLKSLNYNNRQLAVHDAAAGTEMKPGRPTTRRVRIMRRKRNHDNTLRMPWNVLSFAWKQDPSMSNYPRYTKLSKRHEDASRLAMPIKYDQQLMTGLSISDAAAEVTTKDGEDSFEAGKKNEQIYINSNNNNNNNYKQHMARTVDEVEYSVHSNGNVTTIMTTRHRDATLDNATNTIAAATTTSDGSMPANGEGGKGTANLLATKVSLEQQQQVEPSALPGDVEEITAAPGNVAYPDLPLLVQVLSAIDERVLVFLVVMTICVLVYACKYICQLIEEPISVPPVRRKKKGVSSLG